MKIKLLVTHQNPDPDAVAACWLWFRYGGEAMGEAQLYFVPSGEEISDEVLALKGLERNEVIHVDTGMGPFDHHQPGNTQRDSATLKVYDHLIQKQPELREDTALLRIVRLITDNDHFASCWWPEADNDRYLFMFEEILKGLRAGKGLRDHELVELGCVLLDGVLTSMQFRVKAEADIIEKGVIFSSPWGKALGIENKNDEVVKLAQMQGYALVVRKDAESGHVRIKAVPDRGIDLTPVFNTIKVRDTQGTWYFHPAKTMLINGSRHNDNHVPTPLSLEEVIDIIKRMVK